MIQNDTHFVSFLGFHTISQSHKTYSNWFALGGSQVAQFTQILPGSPVWGIRHRSYWQTYRRSEKLRSTPGKNGSMSRELSQHVMGMIQKLQDMSVTFQCYIFIIKYTVSILYIYIYIYIISVPFQCDRHRNVVWRYRRPRQFAPEVDEHRCCPPVSWMKRKNTKQNISNEWLYLYMIDR